MHIIVFIILIPLGYVAWRLLKWFYREEALSDSQKELLDLEAQWKLREFNLTIEEMKDNLKQPLEKEDNE